MKETAGKAGVMKSEDKIKVKLQKFDKYDGKHWVKVFLRSTEWVPSFADLFEIIQAICFCEDEKYPDGHGRFLVRDFLKDSCEMRKPEQTRPERLEDLRKKYKFIDRSDNSIPA